MTARRYSSEAALALLGDALEEAAGLQLLHWRVLCHQASRLSADANTVAQPDPEALDELLQTGILAPLSAHSWP